MATREASSLGHHSTLPAGGRGQRGCGARQPKLHVMDLDRPDYRAPGMDQISRAGAPYIIALGLGGVLKVAEKFASIG
jgi:hypothetical protein